LTRLSLATLLLALFLLGATSISYRYPIHLRMSSKIYMGSAVFYLTAVLLPPALAATITGCGVLLGELSVLDRTGNYPSDIATHVGRFSLVVLAGSLVSHLSLAYSDLHLLVLVATGIVLWAGDLLTSPLSLYPLTGERPIHIIRLTCSDSGTAEAAQYLIGLTAALEAMHDAWALVLFLLPAAMVYVAFKNTKEMRDDTRLILESMADTVDMRDPYTGGHSRRVTEYTEAILRAMEKHGPEVELIISAARVHDIGKIAIPDGILNKPGKLTDEERAVMESHAERGAEVLRRYKDFARGVAIVRHHHESWDGGGYPHRLRGTDIPFGARVIAVADSYDAMTSDRPYRKGMTPAQAARILRDGRGIQWDPAIVDAWLRSIAPLTEGSAQPALRVVPYEGAQTGATA
jgi:putative nucleotidyltransferase with HDIG domain